ncbi:hypothetical protein G6O69_20100 [Pseudenhygromyxa sp. WMMC2535]|uniref:hypothetical protein n=1 Tax=Pseudenhygromyxa sp. WMMC2535 TaxID=2712867 RepID=UPI001554DF77|nr:hypothetical protein [Pseudenhygromyxa sp. WMMC2535]NVB40160.1 hypothetical protein [Pseudenhygromyxa sp. WMMC2535]
MSSPALRRPGRPSPAQVSAPTIVPGDPRAQAIGRQVLDELQRDFRARMSQPESAPQFSDGAVSQSLQRIALMQTRRAPASGAIQISDPSQSQTSRAFGPGPRVALVGTAVHCWAETAEAGADEIVLGGFCTDPFGNITPLDSQLIDSDFDEGETVRYEHGQIFACVDILPRAPSWPATYSITLTLIERDCEGFDTELAKLWQGLKPHVDSRLSAAVGMASVASQAVPTVAVTTWVVGSFLGWMRSWSKNDLIGTQMISFQLEGLDDGAYARAGLLRPQPFRLDFAGAGGHYTVDAYLTLLR